MNHTVLEVSGAKFQQLWANSVPLSETPDHANHSHVYYQSLNKYPWLNDFAPGSVLALLVLWMSTDILTVFNPITMAIMLLVAAPRFLMILDLTSGYVADYRQLKDEAGRGLSTLSRTSVLSSFKELNGWEVEICVPQRRELWWFRTLWLTWLIPSWQARNLSFFELAQQAYIIDHDAKKLTLLVNHVHVWTKALALSTAREQSLLEWRLLLLASNAVADLSYDNWATEYLETNQSLMEKVPTMQKLLARRQTAISMQALILAVRYIAHNMQHPTAILREYTKGGYFNQKRVYQNGKSVNYDIYLNNTLSAHILQDIYLDDYVNAQYTLTFSRMFNTLDSDTVVSALLRRNKTLYGEYIQYIDATRYAA
jgi:hypothetical protein